MEQGGGVDAVALSRPDQPALAGRSQRDIQTGEGVLVEGLAAARSLA
jgi:hypothetical protein